MLANSEIQTQTNIINTLIIGWNTEAVGLYDKLLNAPVLGYNVRGFVRPSGFQEGSHYKNVPLLGDLNSLQSLIDKYDIDELLILLSPAEQQYLSKVIEICKRTQINYRIVSDAYDTAYKHVVRNVISDVLSSKDFGIRRVMDFVFALILLLLLLPFFMFVAIVIKIDSSGTVFYSQQRCGKDGRIFSVFKFRSMVQNAEKISGPVWAQKDDPRITKMGKFMRKTRIDELPQLMNILRGDMSFIGPRPERPFFVESFRKKIPMYMKRLKVKPGVTGLAQVTVGYDETLEDVKEKIRKDIEYIENASSLKMNFYVLWKTVGVVLTGEGQ